MMGEKRCCKCGSTDIAKWYDDGTGPATFFERCEACTELCRKGKEHIDYHCRGCGHRWVGSCVTNGKAESVYEHNNVPDPTCGGWWIFRAALDGQINIVHLASYCPPGGPSELHVARHAQAASHESIESWDGTWTGPIPLLDDKPAPSEKLSVGREHGIEVKCAVAHQGTPSEAEGEKWARLFHEIDHEVWQDHPSHWMGISEEDRRKCVEVGARIRAKCVGPRKKLEEAAEAVAQYWQDHSTAAPWGLQSNLRSALPDQGEAAEDKPRVSDEVLEDIAIEYLVTERRIDESLAETCGRMVRAIRAKLEGK